MRFTGGGQKTMGNASIYLHANFGNITPPSEPSRGQALLATCLSNQSIPTWQAQASKGTTALEVIRRGRNSWELHAFTLGPNNRYGRAGE